LAILSLLLMALGFWLAPQQLSSLGLAARNKEPDQLAYYLSIGQGVAGFLNLIPLAVSTKRVVLYLAYAVVSALLLLAPYLYFAPWKLPRDTGRTRVRSAPSVRSCRWSPSPAEEGSSANHKGQ